MLRAAKHRKLIATMDSATQILNIAERRMRQTGYNAVSYRDIANEMGIKSASLHYHFPKKEDLGVALTKRYSENFSRALQEIASHEQNAAARINAFVDIYSTALKQRRLVCLCAVLGAESEGLPERVNVEIKSFFDQNIGWLTQQYDDLGKANPANYAKTVLSLLSGAMVISASSQDDSIFDAAAQSIFAGLD